MLGVMALRRTFNFCVSLLRVSFLFSKRRGSFIRTVTFLMAIVVTNEKAAFPTRFADEIAS